MAEVVKALYNCAFTIWNTLIEIAMTLFTTSPKVAASGTPYATVHAIYNAISDANLMPRTIIWEDGTNYEIQRIKDCRRAASLRAGGVGLRYTCVIGGQEKYLFYEDNNMWFVEGNTGA